MNLNWGLKNLTDMSGMLWRSKSMAIMSLMYLLNSQRLYTISSSAFLKAVLGRWEATSFELRHGQPNRVLYKPLCNSLNLRKNAILKAEGSKTGIYCNASFLPSLSLIFSLPTLSKLELIMKLELHVDLIYKRIFGKIFDKAHSTNTLFSKLEGRIFGGFTVHT